MLHVARVGTWGNVHVPTPWTTSMTLGVATAVITTPHIEAKVTTEAEEGESSELAVANKDVNTRILTMKENSIVSQWQE